MYPVLISSLGIAVVMSTLVLRTVTYRVHDKCGAVEKALKGVLTISTVFMSSVLVVLSWMCLPDQFDMNARITGVRWWYCALAISLGLWSGLLIAFVTEYYASSSYVPVREIAETQKQSAATGVIYGLASGYLSTIIPVVSPGSWHHDPCCPFIVRHVCCGTGSLVRAWRTDSGILPSMRSSLSRTTRAASLRCYNLMSGSENAPTYFAQQATPLWQSGKVLRSGSRLW